MTLKDLARNYCFHDSGFEDIQYNMITHTAKITIDFCNWAQDSYTENTPENQIIHLIFHNVSKIDDENYITNDGYEILTCETITDSINGIGIVFVVYNPDISDVKNIRVYAQSVDFVAKKHPD